MRILAFILCFAFLPSAQAQLRNNLHSASVPVLDSGKFHASQLFDPAHFKLSHSYELSYNSFGAQGMSTGLYTASLNWQFKKTDANVDIGFLHTPFGQNALSQAVLGNLDKGKAFIRNAEVNFYPTKNLQLHLAFSQNPYGNPYGYNSGYGYDRYGGYGNGFSQSGFSQNGFSQSGLQIGIGSRFANDPFYSSLRRD
jgi:hypothetical protein